MQARDSFVVTGQLEKLIVQSADTPRHFADCNLHILASYRLIYELHVDFSDVRLETLDPDHGIPELSLEFWELPFSHSHPGLGAVKLMFGFLELPLSAFALVPDHLQLLHEYVF
jgi:hypothetical protein